MCTTLLDGPSLSLGHCKPEDVAKPVVSYLVLDTLTTVLRIMLKRTIQPSGAEYIWDSCRS